MGVNPKRRQRKLEKKNAERKAKRKLILRRQSQNLSAKFAEASLGRVLHCELGKSTWDIGVGHLWIGREARDGFVAYADFLLDVHCVGVKGCLGNICRRVEYFDRFSYMQEQLGSMPVTLACARKLIEGAVAFAAEANIDPHPDYQQLKRIFGDADVADCSRNFVYGYDGKPFFTQGPHDSLDRCREIISKLTSRYGPDGFHFLMASSGGMMSDDVFALSSEDVDDLLEYEENSEDE